MAPTIASGDDPAAEGVAPAAASHHPPVVIDLGKRSRKKVKKLRRGEGPLMSETEEVLAELRAAEKLDGEVQPIFVIVRQKRPRRSRRWPF